MTIEIAIDPGVVETATTEGPSCAAILIAGAAHCGGDDAEAPKNPNPEKTGQSGMSPTDCPG